MKWVVVYWVQINRKLFLSDTTDIVKIPLKETFERATILKRMWMGAGAISIFIGTLLVAVILTPSSPNDQGKVGLDFIAFYTAGRFVNEGRSADLYDISKVHEFQYNLAKQEGVDLGAAVGPWWNPPFYAWLFVPIAKLPYRQALHVWTLLNIVCAGTAAWILCEIISQSTEKARDNIAVAREKAQRLKIWRQNAPAIRYNTGVYDIEERAPGIAPESVRQGWLAWGLVPVLIALSTPFIHALSHGQNACMSLLLVMSVVVCWRQKWAMAAGALTGLLFYKPQLGLVLTAVLVLNLGWRTLAGLSFTGIVLLLGCLVLPGTLGDFLGQMPKNLHFVQCNVVYMWDRHVTFKAFWRLLLQGSAAGEPIPAVTILATLCSTAVGVALAWVAVRSRQKEPADAPFVSEVVPPEVRRDRLIAATIAATPLLMPFYFDYDQLLLAIPAVLFAADFISRDRSRPLARVDVALLRLWPAQYIWLILNPDVAGVTHLNLGVVMLTVVAGLLISRAGRDRDAMAIVSPEFTHQQPGPRRLAA